MRLVTYAQGSAKRLGAWINNDVQIVDLLATAGGIDPRFASMQTLIEAGPDALDDARVLAATPGAHVVNTADVQLLAPLPRPVQIRDFLSFPGHVAGSNMLLIDLAAIATPDPQAARKAAIEAGKAEVPAEFYQKPFYYNCNAMTVSGPDANIHWPKTSHFIDYELELAVVIGKGGSDISPADAKNHIFGYTIFNDWSARDLQIIGMQGGMFGTPLPGKDFANTIGPCIVTADEIPDPDTLEMEVFLNSERVGGGNSGGMHFKWGDILAYLSCGHPVFPGEVIGSGTVGTGCSMENRHLVRHGDTVELKISPIGTLRNTIYAPHVDGAQTDDVVLALGAAIKQASAH